MKRYYCGQCDFNSLSEKQTKEHLDNKDNECFSYQEVEK